jgi:uncharacterized membrane protein YtjA (UPF0391 family)
MEWYTMSSVFIDGQYRRNARACSPAVSYVLQRAATASDCKAKPMRGDCPLREERPPAAGGAIMLHYAVVFFIIALIAAFFGFGGIAAGAAGIAKILFVVFLIGALVSLLMSIGRRA